MQIKKFKGQTLKDAMNLMKSELGDEAVILGTKTIEDGGFRGAEKYFELTAGVEDDYDINTKAQIEKTREDFVKRDFDDELKELTQKIYGANSGKAPDIEPGRFKDSNGSNPRLPDEYNEISDLLIQREVEPHIVKSVIKKLRSYEAFLTKDNIDSYVVSTISSMIPTSSFKISKKNRPYVISLVGPTGVGKTTCIAKLALISKILHNLNIGLISIDTYRLGALDQLRIFSDISTIDFLVAYEPSDMPKLLSKLKKKDIVFIDTVGRSQNNAAHLNSIKDFLNPVSIDDIYLVLSSTSTAKTMIDVSQKFKLLDYDSVIFTKIDEAVSFGTILNFVSKSNLPIKYLTNGQVIPDDILAAEPEFIANMIYTGKLSK